MTLALQRVLHQAAAPRLMALLCGVLQNATFGNVVELILSLAALQKVHARTACVP